jgi:hypothetical protein
MGLSKHIRDVFFSIYLDRPDLTPSSQHSPFPEKEGEEPFDIPTKWSSLTRLRKPIAFQCTPHVCLLVLVI